MACVSGNARLVWWVWVWYGVGSIRRHRRWDRSPRWALRVVQCTVEAVRCLYVRVRGIHIHCCYAGAGRNHECQYRPKSTRLSLLPLSKTPIWFVVIRTMKRPVRSLENNRHWATLEASRVLCSSKNVHHHQSKSSRRWKAVDLRFNLSEDPPCRQKVELFTHCLPASHH